MRRSDGHCQEPASVAFSVLNPSIHFHGWLSFFITLYYKLPLKQDKYVTVSCPWTIGSGVQDVDITKRLDYSSAIAVFRFSFIVSILRTFAVRVEGWNMIVCVAMGVAQLFVWARWTAVFKHPSNWKLWWL
ncbi:hypothetical protein YC2023_043035 [Brassica napus]